MVNISGQHSRIQHGVGVRSNTNDDIVPYSDSVFYADVRNYTAGRIDIRVEQDQYQYINIDRQSTEAERQAKTAQGEQGTRSQDYEGLDLEDAAARRAKTWWWLRTAWQHAGTNWPDWDD